MRKHVLKLILLLLIATLPGATSPKKVSFDFHDADLVHVLNFLAREMGHEVYLAADVAGRVTLKVDDMPVAEALDLVLARQPVKYDYKLLGQNTLLIAPPEKLAEMESTLASRDTAVQNVATGLNILGQTRGSSTARVRSAPAPAYRPGPPPPPQFNTESYDHMEETGFREVSKAPLSTFSVDVDTASYSNVRRFLQSGQRPPKDAVRVEEMINYFSYDFPRPEQGEPFSVSTELAGCPWQPEHQLLQVALSAPAVTTEDTPPRNLVFLFDVSGSMYSPDKLPLLKSAARLLVNTLRPEDRVAIVVYAGASGEVLPPTSGREREKILVAIEGLQAGGSTNGGAGIQLAYKLAAESFQPNAINRVILATDGDFNVGVASRGELIRLIEEKRESGIFLTVLGFGRGNLKDSTMEQLADKGNGNYAYVDSLMEAKKVLVEEAGATLVTVAKDVKLQIEFNPLQVASYRLIGYENRRLADEDFDDDKKDAGEIGAGHTVTALYEIVPGKSGPAGLRYQDDRKPSTAARSDELALVKLRYKEPDGQSSKLRETVVAAAAVPFEKASENLRFASSVASVGMLLSGSEFKGSSSYEQALSWARLALGGDEAGYRREFVRLVELAQALHRSERGAGPTVPGDL